jgi:carboxylesterase type B
VTVESGKVEGRLDDGLQVFKGIPFAAPPVGELRWRAPQPPKKWTGIRQAYAYGNDAPQKNQWAPHQDEDCLYLNVWAPARGVGFQPVESEKDRQARSLSNLAPVMVWIHGGGFINGSGRINGEAFAKQGFVFVSFNYRLGRLGFFAHPALDQQRPPNEPPANFWLQDQIAALKWIQRNIAQFGGDPDRVTIFGVSAGGTSVNLLMASPLAKGLFQRAIAQSGIGGFGPYRRWRESHAGREPLTKIGEHFAAAQGLDSKPDVAAALRALPWKTVAKIGSGIEDREGFDIVVDDVTLTDSESSPGHPRAQHRVLGRLPARRRRRQSMAPGRRPASHPRTRRRMAEEMSGRGPTGLVAMLAGAWTKRVWLQTVHRLAMVATREGNYEGRQDHDAKRVEWRASVRMAGGDCRVPVGPGAGGRPGRSFDSSWWQGSDLSRSQGQDAAEAGAAGRRAAWRRREREDSEGHLWLPADDRGG